MGEFSYKLKKSTFIVKFQCKGKNIWWNHLKKFYDEDSNAGMGLQMVPKLKFEHLHINSFSAMRVDFAAQVVEYVSFACLLTAIFVRC